MDNADTYFMQMQPPPLDGLFGADDTTPAAAHNAPLRATEREETTQAGGARTFPGCGFIITGCDYCGKQFKCFPGSGPLCPDCLHRRHDIERLREESTTEREIAAKDAKRIEHMAKRVKPATIEERFAEFVRQHPDVVEAVVKVCRQMKASGKDGWSIDAAFHVVRWQMATSAHGQGADFALNNTFTAPMGRYIMATFPDLAGYFETRRRRCELPGCLEVADD